MMTKLEAQKVIDENKNFVNKKVIYENKEWVFKKFIIVEIPSGEFIVKVLLSNDLTSEYIVPFDFATDFILI